MSAPAWPTELVFDSSQKHLRITFDDGARFDIPFELLRAESPSAEVRGHGAGPLPPVGGKLNVGVADATFVGRYAVRIVFDDGHDSGLFSWALLRDLGENRDARWAAHLARLAKAGLSR
jgi:DUF971 family protein